jgi:hypothetical protein
MSRSASLARQLQAESKYVLLISETAFLEGDDESHRLLVARAEALQDEATNLLARAVARRTLSLQLQQEGILS